MFSLIVFFVLAFAPALAIGQGPQWIWHPETNNSPAADQTVYFRKTFRTPPLTWNARLALSADDEAEVFLNAVLVAHCRHWDQPARAEVSVRLNQGDNVLAVRARNRTGPAGLLVHLNLNGQTNLLSDGSWLVSNKEESGWSSLPFNAAHWIPARLLGPGTMAPWGDVLARPSATPPEMLTVPPDFKVELLRSAEPDEGSWICLAFDERGRVLISPQGDERPLLRLTLGESQVNRVETIPAPVRYAMGLLFAHGSLYANAHGPEGAGLYRLTDRNGNDQLDPDEMKLLQKFEGGSEHGYHALALGPDQKIYVLNGNGTKLPFHLAPESPHRNYHEDILSLNPDETGGAEGTQAPNGHILRTDAEGSKWELFAGGFRNAYGFDFNLDGELFVFDSDMEWDWGMPWYRPTRLHHAVSGGEYGWRDGTRAWPDYYQDALPGVADVGIGSPTGVRFNSSHQFPPSYRDTLFALDWSYGRIFAVHLQSRGASYRGTVETFLRGTPLNLTDLAFGPDGAMYFITGGRNTQSGLYRVRYHADTPGPAASPALNPARPPDTAARALRRRLEGFHGRADPEALETLWPHLGSDDRFVRQAARVALEAQDPMRWKERALRETNASIGLTALLALARIGGPETQSNLFSSLNQFSFDALSEPQKLLKLRVLQLTLLRQGRAKGAQTNTWFTEINRHYPAPTSPLNRELSRLLLFLEAPEAVARTLALLDAAPNQEEQLHYISQLRQARHGWSHEARQHYLEWWLRPHQNWADQPGLTQWFADANREPVEGAWFEKYLQDFRREAIAALPPEERRALASLLHAPRPPSPRWPVSQRKFVRAWTVAELLPELDRVSAGRNFARGRQSMADAQCLACHRFGHDGGNVGPELTAAGSKYDRRSLLESILEPSKIINEQYQQHRILLRNGEAATGRLVRDTAEEVVLETDAVAGTRERFARQEVKQVTFATLSTMPTGLANILTKEELLDLLAYLETGGRAGAPAFQVR